MIAILAADGLYQGMLSERRKLAVVLGINWNALSRRLDESVTEENIWLCANGLLSLAQVLPTLAGKPADYQARYKARFYDLHQQVDLDLMLCAIELALEAVPCSVLGRFAIFHRAAFSEIHEAVFRIDAALPPSESCSASAPNREGGPKAVLPDPGWRRSAPMSMAEAGVRMGLRPRVSKKPREAASKVMKRLMDSGGIQYEKLSKSRYIFDADAFPPQSE